MKDPIFWREFRVRRVLNFSSWWASSLFTSWHSHRRKMKSGLFFFVAGLLGSRYSTNIMHFFRPGKLLSFCSRLFFWLRKWAESSRWYQHRGNLREPPQCNHPKTEDPYISWGGAPSGMGGGVPLDSHDVDPASFHDFGATSTTLAWWPTGPA